MAVRYVPHDGELVSEQWKTALVEMEKDLPNNVNEGHRTLARQQYFWNCYQCKCCNNGNLAAFPNANAPHIRTGRFDHAIDFSNGFGAEQWLDNHGISAWRTVRNEPWHAEVDAGKLEAFHKKHKADKWEPLPDHIEKEVRKLIFHRQGARATKGKKPARYRKHKAWRAWHRGRLEVMLRRADKASTKKLLRELLNADKRKTQ